MPWRHAGFGKKEKLHRLLVERAPRTPEPAFCKPHGRLTALVAEPALHWPLWSRDRRRLWGEMTTAEIVREG
jgi:hypothetical protein